MTTDTIPKFIIIDDHPLIRHGIIEFIKKQQRFECIGEFEDIRSVLNSDFAGQPNVIILDLNLGNVDGSKFCKTLKEKFTGCKIVAFTQYTGMERELDQLGFDGYVQKSEEYALINAMETVLQGGKYFTKARKAPATKETRFGDTDDFSKMKNLTPREVEVAGYIAQEFSNKEIANTMYISEETVETHRKHIKQKLEVKSRRELYTILKRFFQ